LYSKIERYVVASIALLKDYASKESIPRIEVWPERKSLIDYNKFIGTHLNDLEKLPEFIDCAEYMSRNRTTLKAINRGWKDIHGNVKPLEQLRGKLPLHFTFFPDLHYILERHVRENNDFVFSKEKFEIAYKEFQTGIYSSYIKHRAVATLEGFAGDIEEFKLGNGFKIRKKTEEEKKIELTELPFPSPTPFFVLDRLHYDYVLEVVYTHAKGIPFNTSQVQEDFNDIVTVLRLYKPGCVTIRLINSEPITWYTKFRGYHIWNSSRSTRVLPEVYKINKSDLRSVLRLWRNFKTFREATAKHPGNLAYFNLALKRFNFGIEENDLENKIIDFVIAFEVLCLTKSKEKKDKLSKRVATLLAENEENFQKIKKFMRDAYEIRNDIVHEGRSKTVVLDGKTTDLGKFTLKLEEYLRRMLNALLTLSKRYTKKEDVIAELDKSLLNHDKKKQIQRRRFVNFN
jgi:hypothetical protein